MAADNDEYGEFSSVSEGWSQPNHLTTSFTPDWLGYSDNQDWASGVIPNNEQPSWNASFPELPKELSNLLSDEMTSLDNDTSILSTAAVNLPTNGSGHELEADEFGDFEYSLDNNNNNEITTSISNDTTVSSASVTSHSNSSSLVTNKLESSWTTGGYGGGVNAAVTEDDEFGDFEGPSIPKQPDTVQVPMTVGGPQDDAEDEFGGFVSTTTVVKEDTKADDDFGSFETAEFVTAKSFPPLQPKLPTPSTVGAPPNNFEITPTSVPPPSFSTVAESCFCYDKTDPSQSTIDQSLNSLAEQSSLWSSLQSGLKTTSPLYAWNKSHIEDQYFAALKVDPMLVYTILSFAEEMGMAPLAPHDQLLASEVFQWLDSPTEERPQEIGATLLDLTLSSPVSVTPSKSMNRNDSFTLDADLMGLDFTLTDDPQPTTTMEEGLPTATMVTETSNSKTADAIADILGLSTNPYLTSKEDNNHHQSIISDVESANEFSTTSNMLSLSQPLDSLVVSKEELQSTVPSQDTLDVLKASPNTLQLLSESDNKPILENDQSLTLSSTVHELLNSLPDVTYMLSITHNTKHT